MRRIPKLNKPRGLNAELIKGFGGSAGIHILSIILTMVSGVLLARMLGPDSYGIYSFVISLITVLSLPIKAGIPTLLVREVARSHVDKEWGRIRGLLKFVNGSVISYSVLVFLISWILWMVSEEISGDKMLSLLWSLWLLPLLGLEAVRTGALRGLRWILSSQIPEKLVKPFTIIAILGMALLYKIQLNSINAIQVTVVGAFVAWFVGLVLLRKAVPEQVRLSQAEYEIKPWVKSLIPLTIFAALNLVDSHLAILLLGMLGTAEEVGQLKVAITAATLVAFGLTAINMGLAPQVARLHQTGKKRELQRLITLSTRVVAGFSFPVAFVLIIWGDEIVSFIFGGQYAPAAKALTILCIGQLINTSCGSVALIVNMTGNEKLAVVSASLAVFLHSVVSIILIPYLGLIGAAVGYSVSLCVWNILLMFSLKKKTGIKSCLQ